MIRIPKDTEIVEVDENEVNQRRKASGPAARGRPGDIRNALRDLGIQLSLLNYRVSAGLDMRDVDLVCLNLIHRHGPISPSALARLAGLPPATMTGILDRLETGGWMSRERDPEDRRAVVLTPLPDRNSELFALLAGMNSAVTEILEGYDESERRVILEFLERTVDAGARATEGLGER